MSRSGRLLAVGVGLVVAAVAGQTLFDGYPYDAGTPEVAGMDARTVERVVDGDTLYLSGMGESVRLIGVDTPESVHPTVPDECYGHAATRTLSDLLPAGTRVRVSYDQERTDRYGRTLAYVWTSDGVNVSVELVRLGAGEVLTVPPNDAYVTELEAAEDAARTAGRGLWGACRDG